MRWSNVLVGGLVAGILGGAAVPVGEPAGLQRALDTVDAARLAADLAYVAADEMGGRDTPSLGQRLTARFLVNRLERLGFQPGCDAGFLHPYELERARIVPGSCSAVLSTLAVSRELTLGRDYTFYSRSMDSSDVSGELVFVPDLAAAEGVEGKWVLTRGGDRSMWRQSARLGELNALGLVVLPEADVTQEDFAARAGERIAASAEGRVSWPAEGGERGPAFPTVFLSPDAGKQLLEMVPAGMRKGDEPVAGRPLGIWLREVRACETGERVVVENVVGLWPGSDPARAADTILVSAHYDHVGVRADGDVYNGADDNGSGTVGLLALAEALQQLGPLRSSVLLLWVSGEEKGLLGSRAWVENPRLPGGLRPVANINVDMISRNAPEQLLFTPTKDGSHAEHYNVLSQWVEELAPLEGFTNLGSADRYYERSDQYNFAKLGIPVVFLFSDVHEDYHQVTDTADRTDPDKIRRVVRLLLRILERMDSGTV